MRIATLMAGTTLTLGMIAAAVPSQASPRLPHMTGAGNIVVQAHDDDDHDEHRGMRRHRWWQPELRIVREHRDDDENSCREVRHECAERFDWGTWYFRRCVRRHGC